MVSVLLLKATMHEDAEDQKISRWNLMDTDSVGKVKNIYDLSKKSYVIEFQGEGTRYGYELKSKKVKKHEYYLSWQMKFSEDFVFIVLIESNIGKHYLVYTSGIFQGHMQYGLGYESNNGKWQTIKRNLQEDISYFDNRIKVVSFKSFVVKGNGRIDNIKTKKIMYPEQENLLEKQEIFIEKQEIFIEEQEKIKVFQAYTNTLPVITLKGSKFVQLSLGEKYVEKGVSAYDKEDGDINVETMENIDFNTVGRYMVLYMARDKDGNMAVDKRYVQVGDLKTAEVKSSLDEEDREELDKDEEDRGYGERSSSKEEKQVQVWKYELSLREQELNLREKEIAQREKKSNKN